MAYTRKWNAEGKAFHQFYYYMYLKYFCLPLSIKQNYYNVLRLLWMHGSDNNGDAILNEKKFLLTHIQKMAKIKTNPFIPFIY